MLASVLGSVSLNVHAVVGFLVSRVVLVAVPRLSALCLVVSLNVHAVGVVRRPSVRQRRTVLITDGHGGSR